MKKQILAIITFCSIGFSISAKDDHEDTVRNALHALTPTATIEHIEKSAVPGFYEVMMGGNIVYVSEDGKHLFRGNLFDIPSRQDLTEQRLAKARKLALDRVPSAKRIVFAPEKPKYKVTVFTDIDCPYCRNFHQKIALYNQFGIAVDYILFPLSMHPNAQAKAVAVWCAADRNNAYTAAMAGKDPGSRQCENPIIELTGVGNAIGVNGTPSIFAEDGTRIPPNIAYVPEKLVAELDRIAALKKASP